MIPVMRIALITASVALAFTQLAAANPTGGTVAGGSATISASGSSMTVNSSSNNTIINWTGFSVGASESVRFNQPSTSSSVLNRVTGPDGSSIAGSLSSNGHIFLVNPNGVVIAPGAQIDVASLTVSTFDVSDSSFLSGNPVFSGSGAGTITVIGGGLPTGGVITSGGATLNTNNTINVTTSGGTINWTSFGVGAGGSIGSVTATGGAAGGGTVLLRATSGLPTPSQLQGALVTAGAAPRGAEVNLNLEKREVSF